MFRTCCALHANNDAADEMMQMDELNRVEWLNENGHVDHHYPCPFGDQMAGTQHIGSHEGEPALFDKDHNFIENISYCPGCGQEVTAQDNSGIPNHWGQS